MKDKITCARCRRALLAYLDEALAASEHAVVEAHLADCAACTRELDAWRALGAAVKAQHAAVGPTPAATRRMWAGILATIAPASDLKGTPVMAPETQAAPAPAENVTPTSKSHAPRRRLGLAAAAAVLICLVLVVTLNAHAPHVVSMPPPPPPLVVVSTASATANSPMSRQITVLDPQRGKQLWHFLSRHPLSASTTSSIPPVSQWLRVVGDILYITSDDATGTGYLYAFQLWKGEQLWRVPLGTHAGDACLAADSNAAYVFVPPRASTGTATLAAYKAANGASLWRESNLAFQTCLGLMVPTITVGNTWLLAKAQQRDSGLISLVAFDAATGKSRWTSPTMSYNSPVAITNTSATYNDSTTSVFYDDGANVIALDAATGGRRWVRHGIAGNTITLAGDSLIVIDRPTCIYCPNNFVPKMTLSVLDLASGTLLWQRQWQGTPGTSEFNVGFANDATTIYIADAAHIQAVGLRTNDVVWTRPAFSAPSPFVADGFLYLSTFPPPVTHSTPPPPDTISAWHAQDGSPAWNTRLPLSSERQYVIAVTNGLVLASATRQTTAGPLPLTALDPQRGTILWQTQLNGLVVAIVPNR
jgi:outer membrane protein assembly factor BamB